MRKKKSAILEAVHETAKDLHKAGLMNQTTLREFEHLCLPPIEPLEPNQIKEIRESSQVSQAVECTYFEYKSFNSSKMGNRTKAT